MDVQCHAPRLLSIDDNRLKRLWPIPYRTRSDVIGEQEIVCVNITRKNDHLLITVSNSGREIQQEEMEKLFQPFFST